MDKVQSIVEFDVSEKAWGIYKMLYGKNMGSIDFLNDVKKDKKRFYIVKSFEYNGKASKQIKFSGELDFNISKKRVFGFGQSRYDQFKKFLNAANEKNKDKYLEFLNDWCNKLCYQEYNISLMPQTGCLQLVKKNVGNDRLDVFVWCLNEYYTQSSNIIFNFCSFENIESLKSYLDIFNNINEYCEAVYHINKTLTDELVVSGSKALDSAERVMEYLDLAYEFCEQKKQYIENHNNS